MIRLTLVDFDDLIGEHIVLAILVYDRANALGAELVAKLIHAGRENADPAADQIDVAGARRSRVDLHRSQITVAQPLRGAANGQQKTRECNRNDESVSTDEHTVANW